MLTNELIGEGYRGVKQLLSWFERTWGAWLELRLIRLPVGPNEAPMQELVHWGMDRLFRFFFNYTSANQNREHRAVFRAACPAAPFHPSTANVPNGRDV